MPSLLLVVCSFTNQVLAQLDVLKYWTETTAYKNDPTSCRYSSMRKWRICILLHSVRRSMSPPKIKQIIQESRLKALSRVVTSIVELEAQWRVLSRPCGDELCDAHVLHVVSLPAPNCCWLQCRAGVYPAWHFTLLHRGPARPLPLLTEWSAPIPAWRSLVMGQPCTP